MKWFIVVALLFSNAYAQTQSIDITGNLVNNTQTATTITSTWQNAKFVNSLDCWKNGDPNCSAGQPYIRPDGNINFSYGYTELYQVINVSKALPNNGSGLVTTGFTFSWMSKNGNGWDDGRLDELKAYVQGYSKSGQWIENFNYNLNFIHNWTTFSWTQNWSKLQRPDNLANVVFGFAGKDNNYWMGPYGPEITNVSFQLKYKPDPCVKNALYSPECPNFTKELAEITATPQISTNTYYPNIHEDKYVSTSNIPKDDRNINYTGEKEPGAYNENNFSLYNLEIALNKVFDNETKSQEQALEIALVAVEKTEQISQQTVKQAEQRAKDDSIKSIQLLQESQQQVQQSILETKQQQNTSQNMFKLPDSVAGAVQAFNLPGSQLNSFQPVLTPSQIQQQTTQQNLNTNKIQEQIKLAGPTNSSQQVAAVIQASQPVVTSVVINNFTSTTSVNELKQTQTQAPIILEINSIPTNTISMPKIDLAVPLQAPTTIITSNTVNIPSTSIINDLVITNETLPVNISSPTIEIPQISTNFLTNTTNPIAQAMDIKPVVEAEQEPKPKPETKNTSQTDNSIVSGISINSIAVVPVGFSTYTIALVDTNFYQPKEIYRNQRTVDNRSVLQNLRSDELHEQMKNQQWR